MLCLSFYIGQERYALPAQAIIEVLPLVHLQRIPRAPDFVGGVFNYRGSSVPVIDMARLGIGSPCQQLFSTRIILVEFSLADAPLRLLGLLVEKATDTLRLSEELLQEAVVSLREAPFLGKVTTEAGDVVQLINVAGLLTDDVRDLLYANEEKEQA